MLAHSSYCKSMKAYSYCKNEWKRMVQKTFIKKRALDWTLNYVNIRWTSFPFLWCTHDGTWDTQWMLNRSSYVENLIYFSSVWDVKQDFLCMPLQGQTNVSLDVWGQPQHSHPCLVSMPKRSQSLAKKFMRLSSLLLVKTSYSHHSQYVRPAVARGPPCALSALEIYITWD